MVLQISLSQLKLSNLVSRIKPIGALLELELHGKTTTVAKLSLPIGLPLFLWWNAESPNWEILYRNFTTAATTYFLPPFSCIKYTVCSEFRSFCAVVTGRVSPWARAEASPMSLIISESLLVVSLKWLKGVMIKQEIAQTYFAFIFRSSAIISSLLFLHSEAIIFKANIQKPATWRRTRTNQQDKTIRHQYNYYWTWTILISTLNVNCS